jgi:high-affinity iron transporter
VQWADALPGLLIGLPTGLGTGLVVTMVLAARRDSPGREPAGPGGQRNAAGPLWLGVLGAVVASGSFAAVLTFAVRALSGRGHEVAVGLLSVLAAVLVTTMIVWMRQAAAGRGARLRAQVAASAGIGAGALTLTAFLMLVPEALVTTLFVWAVAEAPASPAAPLAGVGLGLAAGVAGCWLLQRQAVRLDLATFFSRTAIAMIVIAAGLLAHGLGDLQGAGWLPGQWWVAFNLNSWWVSLISGLTELPARMTVLQVVAWVAGLALVLPAFVRGRGAAASPAPAAPAKPAGRRWQRIAARPGWLVTGGVLVAPVLVAGLVIAALPASAAAAAPTSVTVTSGGCAPQWSSGHTGAQTFDVDNQSGMAGEVFLDNAAGSVVANIETIGPATTVAMPVSLGPGSYRFVCLMASGRTTRSAPVQVAGRWEPTTTPVQPVTVAELNGPNQQYQAYVAAELVTLQGDVSRIETDLTAGNLTAARQDWLTAQMDWERVGASYDSFGAPGLAVDGLPGGLPLGVNDPNFTGLHRLEYGLYHGQSPAELLSVAETLGGDIITVQALLTTGGSGLTGDPTNLPIRAHEILEDALRDHLSGIDNEGAGAAYPETYADTQVTATVLGELQPLITARMPRLMPVLRTQLAALQAALLATQSGGQWVGVSQVPQAASEQVDAAIGALLQNLDIIPNLLETPPSEAPCQPSPSTPCPGGDNF